MVEVALARIAVAPSTASEVRLATAATDRAVPWRGVVEPISSKPRRTRVTRGKLRPMAAYDVVLDQALQLSDEERGKLAARLLQSLDPDDDELSPEQWDDVWSAELDQRVREVREGTVELIDGDEMLAELDAIANRP